VRLWVALMLVSAGAQAQPYIRTLVTLSDGTDACVVWSTRNITYQLDSAGSARTGPSSLDALEASWNTWQAVSDTCSDFKFTRGPDLHPVQTGNGSESTHVLTFREVMCSDALADAGMPNDPCLSDGSCGDKYGCFDHSFATIAFTDVRYSTRTGVIVDADIEFNAASFLFTTVASPPCDEANQRTDCVATDIQNTATHEIGHVLGFDHVPNDTSTMSATAVIGETSKRSIDFGTQEGFCDTYPRGQPPLSCAELAGLQRSITGRNVGSFGMSCLQVAPGEAWLALLALAWLLARSRRS